MDPLASVFSITGSDSGSMTGDMMVHPGDSASPLEIIEWLDRVDEKLDATSYGSVRRGDIPAKLMRETEPIDIDATYPALRVGEGVDANDVARRASLRAEKTAENARKIAERKTTLRDYKNRIAAVLNTAMRESALRTLKRLKASYKDPDVATMYDGPKMLDDMRAKAEAALAAGNEEAEKTAEAEFEAWKSRAPPAGCNPKAMDKHWIHFQTKINPYLAMPRAENTKAHSDVLVSQLAHMGIDGDVRRVKATLKAAGTYDNTEAVMAAFGALLEELYDPQAAIIAAAAVGDQSANRAAHNRGRSTGPKYLPAGQKCKFGTCNIQHTDEYCWRSAEFTGTLPFNLYKKQRALYDEIEEDRKKHAKKIGITYNALEIPKPRRAAVNMMLSPVTVDQSSDNAEAGGGMCDLFGTLGGAVNMVGARDDDMAAALGFDDEYEKHSDDGEELDAAVTDPKVVTDPEPHGGDPCFTSPSSKLPKDKFASVRRAVRDGIDSATSTGDANARNPRGEWYAVPGGPKIGVKFVPLGSYHIVLGPHVVKGLNPVRCSTQEAAESKFEEMQNSKSIVARHSHWLIDSTGPEKAETEPPKRGGLDRRALYAATGAAAFAVLLFVAATVMPSATTVLTLASAFNPRATSRSLGAVYEGAASFSVNLAPLSEMAMQMQAFTGLPWSWLAVMYTILAVSVAYTACALIVLAARAALRAYRFLVVGRRTTPLGDILRAIQSVIFALGGATITGLLVWGVVLVNGVHGAEVGASAAVTASNVSGMLGIDSQFDASLFHRADVVRPRRTLSADYALALGESYGAGGVVKSNASVYNLSKGNGQLPPPGSNATLQTVAVADSGAALPVLNSTRYSKKGTVRRNTTVAVTANGPTTPEIKCDAAFPVNVTLPSGHIVKRYLELKGCLVMPECAHNLVPLGRLATEQNFMSII